MGRVIWKVLVYRSLFLQPNAGSRSVELSGWLQFMPGCQCRYERLLQGVVLLFFGGKLSGKLKMVESCE